MFKLETLNLNNFPFSAIPEDSASKLIGKISELIGAAENLKNPLNENTMLLLQDGLVSWKQLCQLAAKPPLPLRRV